MLNHNGRLLGILPRRLSGREQRLGCVGRHVLQMLILGLRANNVSLIRLRSIDLDWFRSLLHLLRWHLLLILDTMRMGRELAVMPSFRVGIRVIIKEWCLLAVVWLLGCVWAFHCGGYMLCYTG